jgi:hypothetical protein
MGVEASVANLAAVQMISGALGASELAQNGRDNAELGRA